MAIPPQKTWENGNLITSTLMNNLEESAHLITDDIHPQYLGTELYCGKYSLLQQIADNSWRSAQGPSEYFNLSKVFTTWPFLSPPAYFMASQFSFKVSALVSIDISFSVRTMYTTVTVNESAVISLYKLNTLFDNANVTPAGMPEFASAAPFVWKFFDPAIEPKLHVVMSAIGVIPSDYLSVSLSLKVANAAWYEADAKGFKIIRNFV